jgi:hypothetical protein
VSLWNMDPSSKDKKDDGLQAVSAALVGQAAGGAGGGGFGGVGGWGGVPVVRRDVRGGGLGCKTADLFGGCGWVGGWVGVLYSCC